jgi:hypothetical protein
MSAFHDNALMGASGQQGYQISRSVRLRSSASAYLNRTPGSAGNRKTWTWSGWVKRGTLNSSAAVAYPLFAVPTGTTDSTWFEFRFVSDFLYVGGYSTNWRITSQVFRDPSAWYHIVLAVDTTQATANDRLKLYVNGVQVTTFSTTNNPTQNADLGINQASATYIGLSNSQYFDGYLTEINFVDGQALTPSSFGETDAVTGVWKPKKYGGTYGTNGFYLNFSDNSSNTATTIGKDYSGNGNNWTPNNISVTSGVTYDSMLDVPTPYVDGGNGRGNYAVLNPLDAQGTATLSDANLTIASATTAHKNRKATFLIPSSGKWYWELTTASTCSSSVILGWGLQTTSAATDSQAGNANTWMAQNDANQDIFNQTTSVLSTGSAVSGGSIRQVAYDADTGKLWFGINNTWYSSTDLTSGNPSAGTNQCMTLSAGDYFPTITCYNLTANANFGQRPFSYTPPTGFKALNTQNLPEPTIKAGNKHMDVSLYTGNGTNQTVTNSGGFTPDLVWHKGRSVAYSHSLVDSIRGNSNVLYSNTTDAEANPGAQLDITTNGFISTYRAANLANNQSSATYVGWQWKAGGTSSSNTNGSITSTVSVNATAGFSIATYTGTGANATVGHGLGVAPSMIILKPRNAADNWPVWHSSFAVNEYVYLNLTNAKASLSTFMNSTLPSSTVFSLGTWSNTNTNAQTMVAYCFAEVAGYSKFGSYTGNGSTDGVFVQLGFRARYLLIKETGNANSWEVYDTARNTSNVQTKRLFPNDSLAEATTDPSLDILSNGFKCRAGNTGINRSGGTYIYAAFAENPFKISLAR